jgi:glycosyltransferase involved in cell wall biosynthesis
MHSGLTALGHSVQLVRPRQPHDGRAEVPGDNLLLTASLPIPGYPGLRFGLPADRALRLKWQQHRPDIVYIATEGPLGRSALYTAQRMGIPTLTGMHTHFDRYSRHYHLGMLAPLVSRYLRTFHNRSDGTLAPTRCMVEELKQQQYGQVHLWPRGVDAELFDPERRSEQLRAEWGLQPGQLAVIYVGRLAPEKNVQLVMQSYTAIQSEVPSARLIWVGSGPEEQRLARACPDCIFAGPRTGEDLARHYASGDLFLFPSLTETFGNVVLEAMASGLPVVAFRDAAAAELISSGENGRTIKPGNVVDFIATAQELAASRDLRLRLGRAARQRALQQAWPQLIEQLVTLFHQTARRGAAEVARHARVA